MMTTKQLLRLTAMSAGVVLLLSGALARAADERRDTAGTADRTCEIKLDVNRATAAELGNIPGVRGPAAFGIVDYRETHGPFHSLTELLRARDVDALSFSALRDKVIVQPQREQNEALATTDGAYVWQCRGG